jgi:hypothetical protein
MYDVSIQNTDNTKPLIPPKDNSRPERFDSRSPQDKYRACRGAQPKDSHRLEETDTALSSSAFAHYSLSAEYIEAPGEVHSVGVHIVSIVFP